MQSVSIRPIGLDNNKNLMLSTYSSPYGPKAIFSVISP